MKITVNKVLDILNKENRPLLAYELKKHLGLTDNDEVEIVADNGNKELTLDEKRKYWTEIFIWVEERKDSYQRRDDGYFFPVEKLEDFWKTEISFLLRNTNNELGIGHIILELEKQLVNYYSLTDPLAEKERIKSDAGLGQHQRETLLKFLKKNDDIYYVRPVLLDFQSYSPQEFMIGLREWEGKVLSNDKKIIRNQMISILRKHPKQEMPINDLVYSVNRTRLSTLTKKPYSQELIKDILNDNQGRFIVDTLNNIVKLSNDLEYIISYLKSEIKNYEDFYPSGLPRNLNCLLAYVFIGKEFPLKEAEEYVKTRPIIFISRKSQYKTPFSEMRDEFMTYLETLLPDEINMEEWLSQNIALSFYEENDDQIRLLEPKIIEKLSPVFNVKNNPGNLFQFTLEKLIEEKGKNKN